MKRPPHMERIEEVMRSHAISGPGFLGNDHRPLEEIIEDDSSVLFQLGWTQEQVGLRMRQITEAAKKGLETTVIIEENLEASIIDVRGVLPCPWPHEGSYGKSLTNVRRTDTGKTLRWSELSIHMIVAHCFFEGLGSPFRIDPRELVETIMP